MTMILSLVLLVGFALVAFLVAAGREVWRSTVASPPVHLILPPAGVLEVRVPHAAKDELLDSPCCPSGETVFQPAGGNSLCDQRIAAKPEIPVGSFRHLIVPERRFKILS